MKHNFIQWKNCLCPGFVHMKAFKTSFENVKKVWQKNKTHEYKFSFNETQWYLFIYINVYLVIVDGSSQI